MPSRSVALTDEQCFMLCDKLDALSDNLLNVFALVAAAQIAHLSGKKGADAIKHAMDLSELLKDALIGETQLTKDMVAKVTGK